jgi:hypothetical protein
MHFDRSELQQFSPEYVSSLSPERKNSLVEQLRKDLMEAQDRLNRNPTNSSCPPSSLPPWERSIKPDDEKSEQKNDDINDEEDPPKNDGKKENQSNPSTEGKKQEPKDDKKKPGKQRGAQGFGRTQKLLVTSEITHRPECCKGCNCGLGLELLFKATGGHFTIDFVLPKEGGIGLQGTNTKHIYGSIECPCGFKTTTSPHRVPGQSGWVVDLGEWRLIGPMLLAFLVFLKIRMHMTLSKSGELLSLWFGIKLSDGCINRAIREAGRAASHFEPEIIAALKAAGLLHMDETPWKEHKVTRWFWVALSDHVVYYTVGPRTLEVAKRILEGFEGTLMTDGLAVYRWYKNRLRCWSHLDRKAVGLEESWDENAAFFGAYAVQTFESLRQSIYKMRKMEPSLREAEQKASEEIKLKFIYECIRRNDAEHKATRAFSVEILNDADVIFRQIKEPEFPLTNNASERALRNIVILRKMCQGAKTEEGSKAITCLASVIDTLRLRKREIWSFLAEAISKCRSGQPLPPMPSPA